MGKDYNRILEIKKDATINEIKDAFKKLALKYHPDKNKTPGAEEKFKEIMEAYRVLTEEKNRNLQNQFEKEWKKGNDGRSNYDKGHNTKSFHRYQCKEDKPKKAEYQGKKTIQDPPIQYDLFVDLEDIDSGCTKKMKVNRKAVQPDGTTRNEVKILTINIKPGWKDGTKITYHREGNQQKDTIAADIVFIIRDKPHPVFRREGSDIHFKKTISFDEVRF